MTHEHEPWAEQDSDGMWEASCRTCGVLGGPPFEFVIARLNTEDEAFATAAAIFAVIDHGEGDQDGTEEDGPGGQGQVGSSAPVR